MGLRSDSSVDLAGGMDRQTIASYQFSFISLTLNCLTRFGRLFTLNSSRAYFFLYSSISKSHSYATGKYSDVILSVLNVGKLKEFFSSCGS